MGFIILNLRTESIFRKLVSKDSDYNTKFCVNLDFSVATGWKPQSNLHTVLQADMAPHFGYVSTQVKAATKTLTASIANKFIYWW